MIRCKFQVTVVELTNDPDTKRVRLDAQYDTSIPEDQSFSKWTPSGSLNAMISNPAALAQLTVGKQFYVDLTEVPAFDTDVTVSVSTPIAEQPTVG